MPEYTFQFAAYSPIVRQLRTDNSYRLEMDVPESEYGSFSFLSSPVFKDKLLNVTITVEMQKEEAEERSDELNGYEKAHRAHEAAIAEWCKAKEGRTRYSYKAALIAQGKIRESLSELSAEQHRSQANLIHLELNN